MANGGADALMLPLTIFTDAVENTSSKGCFLTGCLALLALLSVPVGIGIAIGYLIHG